MNRLSSLTKITLALISIIIILVFYNFLIQPVIKQAAITTTTSPSTRGDTVTLVIDGYGYTIGDIVRIDKSSKPKTGDVVYYDAIKNKAYCFAFGPGVDLAKIAGQTGDEVIFTNNSFEVNGQTFYFRPHDNPGPFIWGDQKYNKIPTETVVQVPADEYVADKWIGTECTGETDPTGSSVGYDRFTIKGNAIIGIVKEKIGHDFEAEREIKSHVY